MKIAFFNYFQNGEPRGLETFIKELSCRLAKNHNVLVLPSPFGTHPTSTDLSIQRRLFLDPVSLKVALWTLKSLPAIARFHPKVVFTQNGGWQSLVISIYCRLTGAKMVVSAQSGPGWDDRWNLLMKPHLFVALTGRQLKWAQKTSPYRQKFSLIPNGVDLDFFKSAGKKKKLDLIEPIIMTVAASTPPKRAEQGIRAVAKLTRGSFLLLGQGPLDERIDKLGYELLGKRRFFHTAVTHDEIPEYYRSADLFTLVSESSEAFGIAYLEAMATNLPIVATDDESRREIVGDAGLFVKNPANEEEYSSAIEHALEKKWDRTPRQQAEKFSWDKIAEKYEDELQKLPTNE